MGNLLRFPPGDRFVRRFPHFVETGLGDEATSFALMLCYPFETLTSIEINPDTIMRATDRFGRDPRVTIVQGSSDEMLPKVIQANGVRSTFFWLDAHCPSIWADEQRYGADPKEYDKRYPLEQELSAIRALRPDGDYFIAIDDLRFYDDRDWGDKLPPDQIERHLPKCGLGFLDPFRATHKVQILLDDSGYALIGPHDGAWLEFRS